MRLSLFFLAYRFLAIGLVCLACARAAAAQATDSQEPSTAGAAAQTKQSIPEYIQEFSCRKLFGIRIRASSKSHAAAICGTG